MIRRISTGAVSYVLECKISGYEGSVAVKIWAQAETKLEARELRVLRSLRHPNLVGLLHVHEGNPAASVLEYCGGGSLSAALHTPMNLDVVRALPARSMVAAVMDIVSGVEHLHAHDFIHRDLTPDHCLLVSRVDWQSQTLPQIKLTGFGKTRSLGSVMTVNDTLSVYMAPELFEEDGESAYGPKVDIYGCGMIFHEMLTGTEPFANYPKRGSIVHMTLAVSRGMRPDLDLLPDHVRATDVPRIVTECWAADPKDRPDAARLLEDLRGLITALPA